MEAKTPLLGLALAAALLVPSPSRAASCPQLDDARSKGLSSSAVMFVWSCPAGARAFRVWSSTGGLLSGELQGRELVLEGLGPNTSLRGFVEALSDRGEALSEAVTVTTLANAPKDLEAQGGAEFWQADWRANGNPAHTLYELQWSDGPEGPWASILTFGTSVVLKGHKPAYVRVRALNRASVPSVWTGAQREAEPRLSADWKPKELVAMRYDYERKAMAGAPAEVRRERLEAIVRRFAGSGLDLGEVQDELRAVKR